MIKLTVKDLLKYMFAIGQVRVIDQPYEVLFHGSTIDLRRDVRSEHVLGRYIESFSISDKNTLAITLIPATAADIDEKEQNIKRTRIKNNYKKGSYKMEG